MISPGVFHGAYGLCSRFSKTSEGRRNADAAWEILVSGVKTMSDVPTSAKASRRFGVFTGSSFAALATLLTESHYAGSPITTIGIPGFFARTPCSVAMNFPSGQRRFGSDADRLTSNRFDEPPPAPAPT